jgi:hypothetical protein
MCFNVYGAIFPIAHFTGERWLKACRKLGMLRDNTPPMRIGSLVRVHQKSFFVETHP